MVKCPKVTVLMTVYNDEQFVREAVESVLSQSFKDFEFIIIDDGSIDRTPEVLREYLEDPRIRVVAQDNLGVVRSRNRGLSISRGEYVAIHDSDDVSSPDRLAEQVAYLDSHKDVAAVGSSHFEMTESGQPVRLIRGAETYDEVYERLYSLRVPFAHPSSMYRRAIIWDVLDGYREYWPVAEDIDLWFRLIESYHMIACAKPLLFYRIRHASMSHADPRRTLFYTVLAAASAAFRKAGLPDPYGIPSLWHELTNDIQRWLNEDGYNCRAMAKRSLALSRMYFRRSNVLEGFAHLVTTARSDPWFWRYKGAGLSYMMIVEHLVNAGFLNRRQVANLEL